MDATHPGECGRDLTYISATDKTNRERRRDVGTSGGNVSSKDLCAAQVGGAGVSAAKPHCEERTFLCRDRAYDGDEREYVFLVWE